MCLSEWTCLIAYKSTYLPKIIGKKNNTLKGNLKLDTNNANVFKPTKTTFTININFLTHKNFNQQFCVDYTGSLLSSFSFNFIINISLIPCSHYIYTNMF